MSKRSFLSNLKAVPTAFLAAILLAVSVSLAMGAPMAGPVGNWEGTLDTGNGTLRIVLHVTQDKDGKLAATLDSPDQGAAGIEISTISFNEPTLHFEISQIGGSYEGKLNKDKNAIEGTWSQGGNSFPLTFKPTGK